jgi:ribosomal protein S18 acetylase RimI-like enzyme
MAAPATEIRPARPDEAPHAIACLVAAFLTDPLARFAWPSPHDYLRAAPLVVRELGRGSFAHGGAHVSADLRAVAFWFPPGARPDADALARVLRVTAEPAHLADLLGIFEKAEPWHPAEPHWHLSLIGVDPCAQGRGLDAALLRPTLARCDAEGLAACLDATNPRTLPLYERLGFVTTGEIRVGAAPVVIPMLRRPRPRLRVLAASPGSGRPQR